MVRGARWYLVGSVVLGLLGVLAGCSGGNFFVEREPWRHQAEASCINSGAVKEGAGKVRIKAINGPGMCGADFPLKVSALGDSAALGYTDDFRPPAGIPNASAQPRWPVAEPRNAPPPYEAPDQPPPSASPPPNPARPVESRTLSAPPRAVAPAQRYETGARSDQPLSLDPPGTVAPAGAQSEPYDFRRPYGASKPPAARSPAVGAPLDPGSPAYDLSPVPYDHRRIIAEPKATRSDPPPSETRRVRAREPQLPALGPARAPQVTGAVGPVSVSPAATLACPLVSALDQWIASAVQPAAIRWFGQPVVEIRQISAYSCRGMNGDPNARISEHAFGNALDIASFTLADGRKVTVKNGWSGMPEEQGFLRDVQGAACDQFTTVLAPGSNVYHYDHIHVDLMRRNGGRHACNPRAVSGEEVAARAQSRYAAKRGGEPAVTGSVTPRRLPSPAKRLPPNAYSDDRRDRDLPAAVPGEDGED